MMRLYTTDRGIAREDDYGKLSILDLHERDLGELLRGRGLGAAASAGVLDRAPVDEVAVLAPVLRPGKVPIIGLNYRSHAEEVMEVMKLLGREMPMPTEPNFHLTPGSSVIGTGDAIVLPDVAPTMVDYEGEIAAVIGTVARRVPVSQAWSCVAGLTVANDVSARDIQRRAMGGDPTVSVGQAKSLDTFKPLGPCLVTADEFSEPLDLGLRTVVNGEVRQDARTTEFVYQISELVSYVSQYFTLEPGDLLLTGSPKGVGQFTGTFLAPGDVVEVAVERIGSLVNHVVSATAAK
jgi:2-keto-4-pentenoate hydratase/2-oxohepta-3-ene-1,7-dioic acid hydratase in catechol pathway